MKNKKSAFTLIELLVVIAIIAILASILFPVFAQAKAAAKKTTSISNLKQIGICWSLYNADYDSVIMRTSTSVSGVGTAYWWGLWSGATLDPTRGLLYPYTRSAGIQSDPLFTTGNRNAIGFTGFGYNYFYLSPAKYPAPTYIEQPIAVSESQISNPVETVTFASCARLNTWLAPTPFLEGSTYLEPPSSEYPSFHVRAGGQGVTLWADAHARSFRPVFRTGNFGYGYSAPDFLKNNLAELSDGRLDKDTYFDLE